MPRSCVGVTRHNPITFLKINNNPNDHLFLWKVNGGGVGWKLIILLTLTY